CAELLYQNQRIIRLFPILASVIEANVKPTELVAFKHNQNKSIERLKTISAKFLPDLSNEQLYLFIRYQILYALNLYPETVLYEKGSPGVELLNRKPNFITDFSDYLEIIILGIRAKNV
ncbi:transcriptional regulator, TetR family domain protein, partial [Desulfosporosinus sp. OT]